MFFIRELNGWCPFWWGREVQTLVPAGGGSGKAIMILNVTPLAIRANADLYRTAHTSSLKTTANPDYKHNIADLMEMHMQLRWGVQWNKKSTWNQNGHIYFLKVQ